MKKNNTILSFVLTLITLYSCYDDPVSVYRYPIKNFFISFETQTTEVELNGSSACTDFELRIVPEHIDSLKYGTFAGYLYIQKYGPYTWNDYKKQDNTYFVGDIHLNTTFKETICVSDEGEFRILLPIQMKQAQMDTLISNTFNVISYGENSHNKIHRKWKE